MEEDSNAHRFAKRRDLHFERMQAELIGPVRTFPFVPDESQDSGGIGLGLLIGSPESALEHSQPPLLFLNSRTLVGAANRPGDHTALARYNNAVDRINAEGQGIICSIEDAVRHGASVRRLGEERASDAQYVDETGFERGLRTFGAMCSALKSLGIRSVRLLTNDPGEMRALRHFGIDALQVSLQDRTQSKQTIDLRNIEQYLDLPKLSASHAVLPDAQNVGTYTTQVLQDFREINIVVIGGMVTDVCVRNPDLPVWDQCIQVESFELNLGGKGFNQAIAAARLGANVTLLGGIGQDTFGERILNELRNHKIKTSGVAIVPDKETPMCLVFASREGKTSFVGWDTCANIAVDEAFIHRHASVIRSADVVLITLEAPPDAVSAALRIAKSAGVRTVLNPAPPLPKPRYNESELQLELVDVLIPNRWECRMLAGAFGEDPARSLQDVAEYLCREHRVGSVFVTQAEEGCAVMQRNAAGKYVYSIYPANSVNALDTTGASDAFCAGLALCLTAGYDFEDAIEFAQIAGALSVQKEGASSTMPTLQDVCAFRDALRSASPMS